MSEPTPPTCEGDDLNEFAEVADRYGMTLEATKAWLEEHEAHGLVVNDEVRRHGEVLMSGWHQGRLWALLWGTPNKPYLFRWVVGSQDKPHPPPPQSRASAAPAIKQELKIQCSDLVRFEPGDVKTNLMGFPGEIRTRILRYLLVVDGPVPLHEFRAHANKLRKSILLSCKQLWYEGLPMLYGENMFAPQMGAVETTFPPHCYRPYLHHLEVVLGGPGTQNALWFILSLDTLQFTDLHTLNIVVRAPALAYYETLSAIRWTDLADYIDRRHLDSTGSVGIDQTHKIELTALRPNLKTSYSAWTAIRLANRERDLMIAEYCAANLFKNLTQATVDVLTYYFDDAHFDPIEGDEAWRKLLMLFRDVKRNRERFLDKIKRSLDGEQRILAQRVVVEGVMDEGARRVVEGAVRRCVDGGKVRRDSTMEEMEGRSGL